MNDKIKNIIRSFLPNWLKSFILFFYRWHDLVAVFKFLFKNKNISIIDKLIIIKKIYIISHNIESPHTQREMLTFISDIMSISKQNDGIIIEAGCYKGSSSSKFSLAADIVKKKLFIFDSFEGIPDNNEKHDKSIFNKDVKFNKGDYCGSLEEVKNNIKQYGKIDSCIFIKGWFEDTLPDLKKSVSLAYIDVDLASSTKTCLKYIYPLLDEGGILYSQDGHLPLIVNLLKDESFWLNEVGYPKPEIIGLGKNKLIKIIKNWVL